jgi:hypothetical protein
MFFWGLGVELVNAYKMYRIYNLNMGISEKKLLSHFEFQKEIAINYITSGVKKPPPAISTAPRKRNRESAPRASFSETDASAGSRRSARLYEPPQKKKKSERCTDASLSVNGSLKCRLNTDLRHFPYPPNTKKPHCQLHRWASEAHKGESRRNVLLCMDCNVHLCSQCFALFHTTEDLVSKKGDIREMYSRSDSTTSMGEQHCVESDDEDDEYGGIPFVGV